MKILITGPSLNPKKNVSGVSSVVNTIIKYNNFHQYFHYLLGREDKPINKFYIIYNIIAQLIKFPFFVKLNKIEIIHQNIPFDTKGILREFIISCWCRLLKVPVVLHIHGGILLMEGTSSFVNQCLSQSILNRSNKVIVLSELEKSALKNNFNFSNSLVLSNSVNTNIYDIDNDKHINKTNSINKTILFLGRIHESKGVYEILEAFKLLTNEVSFKFILCGEGPLRSFFVQECEKIFGKDFEYRGIVSGNEKIKAIKDADIFILPSHFEGLPMALIETMAYGLIPVVTTVGSIKYVVHHNINGILVNKNDPVDLSSKIKELLINNCLCKDLSQNAIETIKQNYGIENYIIELNKIYNLVIKK
jgi:glycosyltransferase involved in cell wall biosynthesis